MLLDVRVALEPIEDEVHVEEDLNNPVYDIECNDHLNRERDEEDIG